MRLTLNLTHACNLGCDYCFAGTARRQEMPSATGRTAIDWAVRRARESGNDTLVVSMMGGEPLLAFDLFDEFATYARRTGESEGLDIQLQTTTNATLLDGHRLERLAELGAHVAISVDGVPDVHDRTRRTHDGHGTGDAAWAALDRALARLASVSVVAVVSPPNVDELAGTVRALAARGVRRIMLNPDWSAVWTPSQLETWRAAYDGVAAEYVAAYRRLAPFELNLFDDAINLRIRGAADAVRGCGFDGADVAVAPSGSVYGCGRAVGEDRDASASLGAMWDGFEVPSAHRSPAIPNACQECALRPRCASRCACANRESSGDAAIPSDVLCWHERTVIPLADEAAATLYRERNTAFLARFYGSPTEVPHAAGTCSLV
ncbi:MAG: radical SAM protein [Blastocatellia bacterium]|nr:radical SAM protein [Blastocatellia bacterium]